MNRTCNAPSSRRGFPGRLPAVLLFVLVPSSIIGGGVVASTSTKGMPQGSEVASEVREYLDRLEAMGFAGATLVARDGEVLLAEGHGMADRAAGRAWTAETASTIGSITKQFTAAAILKLEMQGELSVSDSIGEFFKGVPADKAGITLHHLLTHTSGLAEVEEGDFDWVSRDEIVRKALASDLLSAPGVRYRYSNLGYSLLGAVIELVSGEPYESWMRANLFEPAGMRETGYLLPGFDSARVAVGYEAGDTWGTVLGRISPERGPSWVLNANGGVHSTVGDMNRWMQALAHDRLLTPGARQKLFTPYTEPDAPDLGYAYGWQVTRTTRGTRRIEHSGSNGIYYADLHYYPEEGVVTFMMTNVAEWRAVDVLPNVDRIVFGDDYVRPPAVVRESAAGSADDWVSAWDHLEGRYRVGDEGTVGVEVIDGRLTVHVEGQQLIDRIWSGEPVGRVPYPELNRRSEELVRALARSDFGPIRAALGDTTRRTPYAESWRAMVRRLGDFVDVEVLGTLTAWFHAGSAEVTWLRLRFEEGETIRRWHWDEKGRLVGLGGSVYPAPLSLRCAPVDTGECIGFHLAVETEGPRFHFGDGANEESRRVRIVVGDRELYATRIGGAQRM